MPTDDDEWRPCGPQDKFVIERWGHNSGWDRCEFTDLHVGDVVRYFTQDGDPINPLTKQVEDSKRHTTAMVMGEPFKNPGLNTDNWNGEAVGWCAEIELMQKETAQ
jgi:hypothetical protein